VRTPGPTFLFVSESEDLHAHGVRKRLQDHGHTCDVLETDALSGRSELSWSWESPHARVPVFGGGHVNVDDVDIIWWRRIGRSRSQLTDDPAHQDVIGNDCESALRGILLSSFAGRWIDPPHLVAKAENKLAQLRIAHQCGLRLPPTLVSQDPLAVRAFADKHHGDVIAKVLRGTLRKPLVAVSLDPDALDDNSIRSCPTIYQARIPGDRHLRVNVFGTEIHAFEITSEHLDWRPYPDNPILPISLASELAARLLRVLGLLGLHMGVFDLKIDTDGVPVWLELNPQGQFLFLQAVSGLDLLGACARFLERVSTSPA
jgi:hypothetical protein